MAWAAQNLETLLNNIGVSIRVICPNVLGFHELTNSCKPTKIISVNVRIMKEIKQKEKEL